MTVLAVLVLAIWVPATSHPLLEAVGMIHQSQAEADSDHDHDHDAADGICALTSANTPVVKTAPVNAVLYLIVRAALLNDALTAMHIFSFGRLGPSPPLLSRSWQFIHRAALPGRAPSFAS